MRRTLLWLALASIVLPLRATSAQSSPENCESFEGPGAGCGYLFLGERDQPRPTLVLLEGTRPTLAAVHERALRFDATKWNLVAPYVHAADSASLDRENWSALDAFLQRERAAGPVEGLRFHLTAPAGAAALAMGAAAALPYEFSDLVVLGPAPEFDADRAPRYQRWQQLPQGELGDACRFLDASLAARRSEPTAPVARRLDLFHRAAAHADAASYFGCFAPGAVFLGTDAEERWPLAEFRTWAMPHFQRESAWVFVPLERHLALAEGGEFAWYDEILGSRSYGLCRATGVLRRSEGRWSIAHTSLSFLIPNERAKDVVALLRRTGPSDPAAESVVYLVRHAEKVDESLDPDLSPQGWERARSLAEELADAGIEALVSTQYRRTRQTLEPLAERLGLEIRVVPAQDTPALLALLRGPLAGRKVLLSGHSNTVPEILEGLGVPKPWFPAESVAYGDLFRVGIRGEQIRLERGRF